MLNLKFWNSEDLTVLKNLVVLGPVLKSRFPVTIVKKKIVLRNSGIFRDFNFDLLIQWRVPDSWFQLLGFLVVPYSRVPVNKVPDSKVPGGRVPDIWIPVCRVPDSRVPDRGGVPFIWVLASRVPYSIIQYSWVPDSWVPGGRVPIYSSGRVPERQKLG